MTKHRMVTGFVAVALLAAAATMRSPSTDRAIASAGVSSLKGVSADVNKLPIEDFDDQSFVFSTKR